VNAYLPYENGVRDLYGICAYENGHVDVNDENHAYDDDHRVYVCVNGLSLNDGARVYVLLISLQSFYVYVTSRENVLYGLLHFHLSDDGLRGDDAYACLFYFHVNVLYGDENGLLPLHVNDDHVLILLHDYDDASSFSFQYLKISFIQLLILQN
jgi:hypothetical protein